MIDSLNSIDTQLFLFLNHMHNSFFDFVMFWLSDKWVWTPMYIFIAVLIVWHYKKKGLLIILFIGLTITLCDQISSHLIKNLVERLRPSHEPLLIPLIHLSKAGAGGLYGFVSSHAANAFGLACFLGLVLNRKFRILKYWLFFWAILVSYSRIYNGVHYPSDVVVASIIGCIIAWSMSRIYASYLAKYL
jgi:PAP2 superfamily.